MAAVVLFDALQRPLGSVRSAFSSNLALSGVFGSSPNEFLEFDSGVGIKSLMITGDPLGSSFTLDDLIVSPISATAAAPESSSLLLLGTGLGVALMWLYQMLEVPVSTILTSCPWPINPFGWEPRSLVLFPQRS